MKAAAAKPKAPGPARSGARAGGARAKPAGGARTRSTAPHAAYGGVVLVLQGGGALGSYQAGVVQGLSEAGIEPGWVAGISIGALNAAVIAGNPPARRIEQLEAFWSHICRHPWLPASPHANLAPDAVDRMPPGVRRWLSQIDAARALLEGQQGFFVPRAGSPATERPTETDAKTIAEAAAAASYYDTSPLRSTLERFADFDRINHPGEMRVSVGAVQVTTGNFITFDNRRHTLRPEHFMASGALPPGFPPVRIDDEFYWDGGLVSNTPLFHVLSSEPRRDILVFQIDLWSARGPLPTTMAEVSERQKDIQYSSRTRMITEYMREQQVARRRLSELLELLPPSKRSAPAARRAAELACDRRCNVIQLIYRPKAYEREAKDYEFGPLTLRDHWRSGLHDIRETLTHPEWLAMPSFEHPFQTHDVHRVRGHASPFDASGSTVRSKVATVQR